MRLEKGAVVRIRRRKRGPWRGEWVVVSMFDFEGRVVVCVEQDDDGRPLRTEADRSQVTLVRGATD